MIIEKQNMSCSTKKTISFVCPFFNEEAMVDKFIEKISVILYQLDLNYELICVNDGSRDSTLANLLRQKEHYPAIRIVDLSRNFGKEAALTAGLDIAIGDAVIPIDVDLQDPPELIPIMVKKWREGAEVVLARRRDRSADSWLKRTSAILFYRFHNRLSDVTLPENVGDFRLMDRRVVDAVKKLPESRRFMKGVFAWVGFQTEVVEYVRSERVAGLTKFNGWKLWNFALEGITSFSTLPLRVWLYAGMAIALFSMMYAIVILTKTIFWGVQLPGYASLIVSVLFLGGVELIGIGVLGEYIGRIYLEAKRRPIYIVRNIY